LPDPVRLNLFNPDYVEEMDIEKILKESGTGQKDLVPLLHKIQAAYGYVPPESIAPIARHLRLSESEVFGVLTFNRFFRLEPKGKIRVTVCHGTACHVRGGGKIVEKMEKKLGIPAGRTTADKKLSLDKTDCLACCAIGPVVVVNGTRYSLVSPQTVDSILEKVKAAE
jgi:NADH:ubiquinone oxidoreductase subunit E